MFDRQAYRRDLDDSEERYKATLLDAYCRCLLAGGQYDVQIVYRLFQIWLNLKSDPNANLAFMDIFSKVRS